MINRLLHSEKNMPAKKHFVRIQGFNLLKVISGILRILNLRCWQIICKKQSITKTSNMRALGIALVVLGIAMMVITGFNVINEKNVADIGPIEVNRQETNRFSWPPIVGGVLFIGGIALIMAYKKKPTV